MAARKVTAMQQHAAAKRAYPDAIIFFRLGDFYEMFGDDALVVSRELELTLTSRNKGKPDEIPMAGVPHHAAHGYIGRLLRAGYKVAICEQMADPSTVKGIVPREVIRVITPGTITHGEHLEPGSDNWLAALELSETEVALALFELSTGELRVASFADFASALGELGRSSPREIVVPRADEDLARAATSSIAAVLPAVPLRPDGELGSDEEAEALGGLAQDAAHLDPLCARAVARALRFARACTPNSELPVRRITAWAPAESLLIDPVAQAHLELVDSSSGDRSTTLLATLDLTKTAPGKRLLRRRLLAPLMNVALIRRRLDLVEALVLDPQLRRELRQLFDGVGDLERLVVRAELGEINPRELGVVRDSLVSAAAIADLLGRHTASIGADVFSVAKGLDTLSELAEQLTLALVERPPAMAKDGAIFNQAFDSELSELAELSSRGNEHIVALEAKLRQETGINTLKARYTRVFGWYLEVTKSQLTRVPGAWRRKQTVANAERYTLPELDDLADRISSAEERHRARELELLRQLVQLVREQADRLHRLAARLADWDVAASLAEAAHKYDYVRPEVGEGLVLEINDGRHPVVERLAALGRFVPNDVRLDTEGERLWIITGPNMAGKSTFLRQTAVITLMAQMGSFVPARVARVGVADRILSRVGASDNLAGGESTFMVEMRETAEILRKATPRSLVILDEIGRGTSTFDGLAIAWAVAEHLDEAVCCRALFATHYHELTELGQTSQHVVNYSVSAREHDREIVFLHRVVAGAASRSYGVAVAKLAGLPAGVVARAEALLNGLESERQRGAADDADPNLQSRRRVARNQLDLFAEPSRLDASAREALDTLKAVDTDQLTPLDALQLIAKLKKKL